MAQKFKEVAHLRTDLDKYGEGYDRIFKKREQASNGAANHSSDESFSKESEERKRVKDLARKVYCDLQSGQDTEGFPEASSFIYGFVKGYQEAARAASER
jgi:hypothetical protein